MKNVKLSFEPLEERLALAAWGNPWSVPDKLTISFAPDGTQVSGYTSTLFNEMDSAMSRTTWQTEILRAFQTWAQKANINLSVVEDNGQAFGSQGPIQGGRLQGDIRIAAIPLAHSELAVATPFDMLGDWSGDVLFNTAYDFSPGGGEDFYDLFTVALQEAGHVFGLPNSENTNSAMYTQYQGPRTALSAGDIANLRELYGSRKADRFDAVRANNTAGKASQLQFIYDADQFQGLDPSQTSPPFVAHGDLTTASDVDFYRVRLPSDLKDFTVELRTSGLSLTNARVSVLNSSLQVVQTATATDAQQGDLSLFVKDATPGGLYYVRVQSAPGSAFGVGAYHLAVGKETHEALFPPIPSFINDDRPDDDEGGDEPLVSLTPRTDAVGPRWDYGHYASVSFQGDLDRYQVVAPADSASAMVVTVGALETDKLDPKVTVYAAGANPSVVPSQVIRNDNGFFTVQVPGVTPGAVYELRVEAADPQSSYKEGNYFLGVDFVANPIVLESFGAGVLTQDEPQQTHRLEVEETRLFHMVLSAASESMAVESAVRMTIYNQDQQVVMTLVARAGETVSADVLLAPGEYTIRFAAGTRNSSDALPPLTYSLHGIARNDPIGPTPVPPGSTPPPPPPTPPYVWYGLYPIPTWIVLQDAYSKPYSSL